MPLDPCKLYNVVRLRTDDAPIYSYLAYNWVIDQSYCINTSFVLQSIDPIRYLYIIMMCFIIISVYVIERRDIRDWSNIKQSTRFLLTIDAIKVRSGSGC